MRSGWELRQNWPCWRRTRSAGPLQQDCQIRNPIPSSQRPKLHLRGPCYFNCRCERSADTFRIGG